MQQVLQNGAKLVQNGAPPRLYNLTPHDIVLQLPNGTCRILERSERPTRLLYDHHFSEDLRIDDGEVPLFDLDNIRSGELPPRQSGVFFVVSVIVAASNKDRDDLLIVHDEIRDHSGRVTACKALARFVEE